MLLDPPVALQASDGEVSESVRVYLVEDQTVLRECLVASLALAPDMVIIGEAADAESALEDHRIGFTDVVVMDIGLPGMSGIEATRILKERRSDLRVVILTPTRTSILMPRLALAPTRTFRNPARGKSCCTGYGWPWPALRTPRQ